ncbi:APC family permease [Pseudonocardia lacus]|uniref:APC family permease n=1 Tax=Pseudonocardia lacus TaxID=2835865 RepID=UPI001BDDB751|nr:APC family permease [Pseudonocardia lacus]
MTTTPHGLARRSVGTGTVWIFGVSASAPMTVLAGGVVTTFAVTGVVAVPASFLVLMAALLLFSVGFAALARDIPHAATFAAHLALGIGRPAGVAAGAVAVLAYNAIQISLYGLLGATASALLGGPWWAWALAAWAVVAGLGVGHIALSTRLIGALLVAELLVIAAFDVAGFAHPADPAELFSPLAPDRLAVDGVGGVLALGVAAFIGFESVTAFREETTHPRSVQRALLATVTFLGLFYAVSSWALATAVGPTDVADAARTAGSDIPFTVLATHLGAAVAGFGLVLLVLSIVGAMISFHNVVARYVFALGREGVLPFGFGTTLGATSAVPVGGSILQSVLAATCILAFALADADPIAMFTLLSTLAAIGVMALMIAASTAVIAVYRAPDRPGRPGTGVRLVAPAAGATALTGVLVVTLANLGSTLGAGAHLAWLLPTAVTTVAAAGAGWALWLRRHRPDVWDAIGRSQPKPLAVLDRALSPYEL